MTVLDEVLAILCSMTDTAAFSESLIDVAYCGARTGLETDFFERILALARRIDNSDIRDETVVALCGAIPTRASALALDAATSLPDDWQRGDALGRVAAAVASVDAKQAVEILQLILEGWPRDQSVLRIISKLPCSERETAIRLARAISSAWDRTGGLALLAGNVCDEDSALRVSLFNEALATAATWRGPQEELVAKLVAAAAETEPNWARSVALKLVDPVLRSRSMATLACTTNAKRERLGRAMYWESLDAHWRTSTILARVYDLAGPLYEAGVAPSYVIEALAALPNRFERNRAILDVVSRVAVDDWKLAQRLSSKGIPDHHGEVVARYVEHLAASDPDTALDLAAQIEESWERHTALSAAIESLAARAPERAIDFWQNLGASDQPSVLGPLVRGLALVDARAAIHLVSSVLRDPRRRNLLSSETVIALANLAPDLALEVVRSFPTEHWPHDTLVELVSARAPADPEWALRVVTHLEKAGDRQVALEGILQRIASSDPDLALDWVKYVEDEGRKQHILSEIAIALAESEDERAVKIAASLSDEGLRHDTGLNIALTIALKDPARALHTMASFLSPEPGNVDRRFVPVIVQVDRQRAIDQVFELPPGEDRDEAMHDLAMAISVDDYDLAWQVADAIDEGPGRALALTELACAGERLDLLSAVLVEYKDSPETLVSVVGRIIEHRTLPAEILRAVAIGATTAVVECGTNRAEGWRSPDGGFHPVRPVAGERHTVHLDEVAEL
ncbi:hypothetical protein [Ornithinimicrobium sp. LYQ103]|uniref:hypothetical protein n=1 Tax=Ornithinimicrobium sp. LYQ103 TaxID=3378796 RepID=UPI003854B67C